MNETLFKNSFVRDKSTSTEIAKGMLLLTRLMKIIYIVAAITLVFNLVFILLDIFNPNMRIAPEGYFRMLFTYAFPSALLALMYFVIKARNTPKEGTSEENFVIKDDEMIWTSAGKEHTYAIKDIAFYFDTKNYFLIVPNAMSPFIPAIKKDSFTLGNSEDFIKFLRNNGIKIQK